VHANEPGAAGPQDVGRLPDAARRDEPSDVPDGAEVEAVVIDDDLGVEQRAALHASLDRALIVPTRGPPARPGVLGLLRH
jgi:hypothetical protein